MTSPRTARRRWAAAASGTDPQDVDSDDDGHDDGHDHGGADDDHGEDAEGSTADLQPGVEVAELEYRRDGAELREIELHAPAAPATTAP